MAPSSLLKLTKHMKKEFILVIIIGTLTGILIIFQALTIARIVDGSFLKGLGLADLKPLFLGLLFIILFRAGLFWLGEVLAHRGATLVKENLRKELLKHLFALGPIYGRSQDTGHLVNTLIEGVEALEVYFSRYLPNLALAAIIPIGILLVAFPQDLLTSLIFLLTAPLIPLFMILIGNLADARANQQWYILGRMSSHFLDVLDGLATLKLLKQSASQAQIMSRLSQEWQTTTMSVLRIAFLSAFFLEFFITISTAIVAVALGLRLIYGKIAFETAFFLLLLAPEYYTPLRTLGVNYHAGITGIKAATDIFELLNTPIPPQQEGKKIVTPQILAKGIAFTNVSFAYNNETTAIKDVSFNIKPGEKLAIVGFSGAGKSTILRLLMGFVTPQQGNIFIGDTPLTDLYMDNWREQIVLVPQNPYLFYGSVKENIAFSRPKATLKEVKQAARLAEIHSIIETLPQGYDTIIGQGARTLSSGQKQRLALARAFLVDSPLVLLDEATTSLDPENEQLIKLALQRLLTNKTAILVAHRLATLEMADKIIVMEKGQIVELGTHKKLLEAKGSYYQLRQAYGGITI
ncbi:ABC transporter type 1, transmembrane domain [Syntrophomonas zehnderi OL-4]|uniref:ABC transporter type 1, transmembrane domain n=1 Tax=Syntrophomonas zehnderi OL-4 TaxID=690567 RepID=A0A0E4GA46_9FIRM|nr:thiol reductant ABC exporter subunit CydD [Syntrophomonas zehnderi]CFX01222.1 ABC transporter type 1, transmembrane domain [Syntrophomonas zehnderi OL-4]